VRALFVLIRRIEAAVLATAMLGIAATTIANVVARNLLDHNLAAAEEVNRFLIVLVCFVGIGYAAGHGRHIRMTAIYDQLPERGRKVVMVLIDALTALLLYALAWFAWRYTRIVDNVSPVLGVPLRLVYLVAPLGLFLGGTQYLMTLWRNLTTAGVWLAYDHLDEHDEDVAAGEI